MELIFKKFLTKTDVASRLSFPSKCLNKLPRFEERHGVDLPVKDKRGSVWRVCCSIRKRKHPKPILCRAWHRFAVSKGLGIDDEVKLFKENDQATGAILHYRVEVSKAIKLFGVTIGHEPPTAL